jgi:hypothetical protein
MMGQRYSDDAMLAEIRRVANGGTLSRPAYQRQANISAAAITVRFGSWSAALEAAGVKSPYSRGGVWFTCPICGLPFRSDRSAKSKRTCSRACAAELRASKLTKGRAASKQAARGRARRFVRVESCARCGSSGSPENSLEIHHRDRDPYNNDPSNLEVVCGLCHTEEHALDRATVCRNGHPRTPDTTYYAKPGKPSCRICRTEGMRRFRALNGRKKSA